MKTDKKEGQNDKLCKLEARLEGMKPIVVSNNGNTHDLAEPSIS
jgi:hypothetical protein